MTSEKENAVAVAFHLTHTVKNDIICTVAFEKSKRHGGEHG
jgi:hypothetical protein